MPVEKIIHTADWHLTDKQFGCTWRSQDFYRAGEFVIREAVKLGVKTIINVGDMLDVRCPPSNIIEQILLYDKMCRDFGIKMLVVSGNHDLSFPPWPEVVRNKIFRDSGDTWEDGVVPFDFTTHQLDNGVYIHGLPFMRPDEFRNLMNSHIHEKARGILAWHGMVKEFVPYAPDGCISVVDFPDYYNAVLLGDIHKCEVAASNRYIGYPGSIEMHKSDEPLDKFAVVLNVHDDGRVEIDHKISIPHRPFIVDRVLFTEDDMRDLLNEIEHTEQAPVVIIKATTDVQDPAKRIRSSIMFRHPGHTEPVIRVTGVASSSSVDGAERYRTSTHRATFDPSTELPKLLNAMEIPGSKAHGLVLSILGNRAAHSDIIEQFIESEVNGG